jgi:hypothetical protein
MMEIAYDLAPGANLAFSNPDTSAEMIEAINILDSTFQCQVICDDLFFPDEPFFQDGPIVTRIDQAVANGAIYCSAAGNEADQDYYEGDYAGITQTIGGQSLNVQNFNAAGDWNMQVVAPAHGGSVTIILQWNDPWGASDNDYDLYLTDSTGGRIYDSSTDPQNGSGDPVEVVEYTNTSFRDVSVYVVVNRFRGVDRHLKIVLWGEGYFTEYYTPVGSTYGHPAATAVIACGAVPASSPNTIEPYSARGPARIDFPSLTYRNKPDLCGVDGVSVTGNGGFLTPFYGTSAATPHVAAVCALVWSFNPAMSGSAVRDLVQTTAVDLGAAGYDDTYGYGRVDAFNAAGALEECQATITVLALPSSGGSVSGWGSYSCGVSATVTAAPNAGYVFVNWTENGTEVSSSPSYHFTVRQSASLVANFSLSYTLTIESAANLSIVQAYAVGASVSVSAPPAPTGERFAFWSGDASGADNPITLVMDRDKTIVANYEACPVQATPCGPGTPVCGLGTLVLLELMRPRSRCRTGRKADPSLGSG